MKNQLGILLIAPIGFLFAMWATTELMVMHGYFRTVILAAAGLFGTLALLFPKVSYDVKVMGLLCMGYALGGKGFAYLSPIQPIFIGEICLAIVCFGLLIRMISRLSILVATPMHLLLIAYLVFGGVHLFFDFQRFGLTAIRDSAMVYYSLFFFGSFTALGLTRNRSVFEKFLLALPFLGLFGHLAGPIGLTSALHQLSPYFYMLFVPHTDILIPTTTAAAVALAVWGWEKKNPLFLMLSPLPVILLMTGKSAAILALGMTMMLVIVAGKKLSLLVMGGIGVFFGVLLLTVYSLGALDSFKDQLEDSDHLETMEYALGLSDDVHNTTDWRLVWWQTIARKTFDENPFFGAGFGSDITSGFRVEYYGKAPSDTEGHARYPHNVLFTVIGRMGYVGLAVFVPLFLAILIYCTLFTKRFVATNKASMADLVAVCVVFAGAWNGLVQMTYESPYGAIVHWICLGYLMRRWVILSGEHLKQRVAVPQTAPHVLQGQSA